MNTDIPIVTIKSDNNLQIKMFRSLMFISLLMKNTYINDFGNRGFGNIVANHVQIFWLDDGRRFAH